MQKIIIIFSVLAMLLLREECHGQSGSNRYTAGINYTVGVPTFVPQGNVSKVAIDTGTMKWYEYAQVGGWRWSGDRVQDISGCAAPAYTPGKAQSRLVLNACTEAQNGHGPELYKYTGSAWLCLNCGGNYTAGDGIDITGTEITNTAPDQVVSITGAGINAITGTYPNFTVTGTEVDGSTTNELQTLSVAGNNLTISDGNTVTLPTPSSTLDALTDVTITTPSNNQILQYNTATTQWVNATLSAIAGIGANTQVSYWDGTSSQTGSANFIYDAANNRVTIKGVGTTTGYGLSLINSSDIKTLRAYNNGEVEIGNYSTTGAKMIPGQISSIASVTFLSGILRFALDRTHSTSGLAAIGMNSGFGLNDGTLFTTATTVSPSGTNTVSHTVIGINGLFSGNTTGDIIGTTALLGNNAGLNIGPTGRQVNLRISTQDTEANSGGTWRGTGSASYVSVLVDPTYNQQSGATGAVRGIQYKPTTTSVLGAHYAATFASGQVGIGTETPSISASLEVTSTTGGILFPRMTATQRDAIASPPDGLVVYNTTASKLQVRAASAWVDLH